LDHYMNPKKEGTTTMVEVEPKATKIRWSDDERDQVLREAASLALKHPRISPLQLARMAQATLPEGRRREIQSLAMTNWFWFTDGLAGAIERAREEAAEPTAPPPDPEPAAPDPDPDLDTSILGVAKERIDALLLASLEQARVERAEMFTRFDARIGAMEAALGRIADALTGGFALAPLGRAAAPVAAPPVVLPAPAVNGQAAPAVLEAPGTGFAPVKLPTPLAPPPPRPRATRKPNVAVLSVPSGHTKNGIKDATRDHIAERLDFWEAPTRPVGFANYDYIVCTKWTPRVWIEEAKLGPWKEKVRVATGNAEQISKFIRELPEIPVRS
jgi:hypothetical protein